MDSLYANFSVEGQRVLQQLDIEATRLGAQVGRAQLTAVGINHSLEANTNVPATERLMMPNAPVSP